MFEEHAAGCESCRKWMETVQRLENIHRSLPDLDPPVDLTDRVMERVSDSSIEGRKGFWKIIAPVAAAVVALGVYAGIYITDSLLAPPQPSYAETTGLEYLDDYPPESVGMALDLALRGERDE